MSWQDDRHYDSGKEGALFDGRGQGDARAISGAGEHHPHDAMMFSISPAARREIA